MKDPFPPLSHNVALRRLSPPPLNVWRNSWFFYPSPVLVTGGHISETPPLYLVGRHIFCNFTPRNHYIKNSRNVMLQNLGFLPPCHTSSTPSTSLTCDVIYGCPLIIVVYRPYGSLTHEVRVENINGETKQTSKYIATELKATIVGHIWHTLNLVSWKSRNNIFCIQGIQLVHAIDLKLQKFHSTYTVTALVKHIVSSFD